MPMYLAASSSVSALGCTSVVMMGLQLSSLDRDFTSQFAQLVNKSSLSSVKKVFSTLVGFGWKVGSIERAFA